MATGSSFLAKGVRYVELAIQKDKEHHYAEAIGLYKNAIEYLDVAVKYTNDDKHKYTIRTKIAEYHARVAVLTDCQSSNNHPITVYNLQARPSTQTDVNPPPIINTSIPENNAKNDTKNDNKKSSASSNVDKKEDQKDEKDEDTCKICFENPIDCVILPCGHYCSCTECCKALSECPICRIKIDKTVKLFKS